MKRIVLSIGIPALGIVVGCAATLFLQDRFGQHGRIESGGWVGNLNSGSPAADPYTRALVAKAGLLALNRRETLYFDRTLDDQGAPLREDCDYRMQSTTLPARWWSVTLYAADDFLAVNGDEAHSVDATRAAGRPLTTTITPRRVEGAWISSRNAGRFALTLRLYHPVPDVGTQPARHRLPTVTRLSCNGDRP